MTDQLLYLSTTAITAFICLINSLLLLMLKPLKDSTIPRYRTACRFLALASGLVAAGHIAILCSGTGQDAIKELFYFPVILISASQALLFTFLLLFLFRGRSVTKRNILRHALPMIVLTAAYFLSRLLRDDVRAADFGAWMANIDNPPLLIRSLAGLTYIVQLGIYTRFFLRERSIYLRHVKAVLHPPERLELNWTTRVFFYALGIGIAAISLCFIPDNSYNTALNLLFATFYPLVSIYYGNYQHLYNQLRQQLEPAASAEEEKGKDMEDLVDKLAEMQGHGLFMRVQNYMESNLPYLNPDFSRDDLARAIGSNVNYLAAAIRENLDATIKEYIDRYRVTHARAELLAPADKRDMTEIALISGFSNAHTFTRVFQNITGTTPARFRREAQQQAQAGSQQKAASAQATGPPEPP